MSMKKWMKKEHFLPIDLKGNPKRKRMGKVELSNLTTKQMKWGSLFSGSHLQRLVSDVKLHKNDWNMFLYQTTQTIYQFLKRLFLNFARHCYSFRKVAFVGGGCKNEDIGRG